MIVRLFGVRWNQQKKAFSIAGSKKYHRNLAALMRKWVSERERVLFGSVRRICFTKLCRNVSPCSPLASVLRVFCPLRFSTLRKIKMI